jgi:uncharacterized membrane protein YfcA
VHQLFVFAAAAGGAINSVAGGGTLLTVPTLIWLEVPAINANATSTVALWPGSLSAAWGFRREMRQADPRVYALVVPSLVGGLGGAILLESTPPDVFERLIPALILFATVLFMVQEPLQRRFNLMFTDLIHWDDALVMAVGAIAGALIGAGTARQVGRAAVRHTIVAVGFAMALSMFLRL